MMVALLALQVPDPDLRSSRIVAFTRAPAALRAFRRAVLSEYQERAATAQTPESRRLAEEELAQMQARLVWVLGEETAR